MRKITIITGAGSSVDYGLPLGSQLIEDIRVKLLQERPQAGNNTLVDLAVQIGESGDFGKASEEIIGRMLATRSIDRFLDLRKEVKAITVLGKLAIADSILERERNSWLINLISEDFSTRHSALHAVQNTWIANIFRARVSEIHPDDGNLIFGNVSFVTFNYDRCIEIYIDAALRDIAGVSDEMRSKVMQSLNIFHVYGSLGNPFAGTQKIPFGADRFFVTSASQSIRLFTEGVESGLREAIQRQLHASDVIILMGFSYDPLNVRNLFEGLNCENKRIIALRTGDISEGISYIQNQTGAQDFQIIDSDCSNFTKSHIMHSILMDGF